MVTNDGPPIIRKAQRIVADLASTGATATYQGPINLGYPISGAVMIDVVATDAFWNGAALNGGGTKVPSSWTIR